MRPARAACAIARAFPARRARPPPPRAPPPPPPSTPAPARLPARSLRDHIHPKTGAPAPLIAEDVNALIQANAAAYDAAINYSRDYDFDFFGFKTLERSYLLRIKDEPAERPQQMFMRVSIGIHKEDVAAAIETYNYMSQRFFTHATPTLFNAGTPRPQLSSCFLLTMKDDSIDGIYETLKNCANISKFAGGIGLSIHNIRATNSYIRGTNGSSNGIVPMLRVFSDTARCVARVGAPAARRAPRARAPSAPARPNAPRRPLPPPRPAPAATWTRAAASARAASPSTSSRGTRTSLTSST